jgi:hypothetical protein
MGPNELQSVGTSWNQLKPAEIIGLQATWRNLKPVGI